MSSPIDDETQMPLFDAAYALWRARHRLEAAERTRASAKPRRKVRPGLSAAFLASVQDAMRAAREEHERAHEGPTFHRLKLAHPEASDVDLQDAIKAAVKLETDANRYFSHEHPDYMDNIREAARLARRDNPGFSEATYANLAHDLAYQMK